MFGLELGSSFLHGLQHGDVRVNSFVRKYPVGLGALMTSCLPFAMLDLVHEAGHAGTDMRRRTVWAVVATWESWRHGEIPNIKNCLVDAADALSQEYKRRSRDLQAGGESQCLLDYSQPS